MYHVCPPVRKIIYSLKLVDYLHVQADNPWYNYYLTVLLSKIQRQNLKKNFFNETNNIKSLRIKYKNNFRIFFLYFTENYIRRVRKSTDKKNLALALKLRHSGDLSPVMISNFISV